MKKYRKSFLSCFALLVALSVLLPCTMLSASADEVLYGDVDGNGALDSFDALMIQRFSIGLTAFTADQQICADVNVDGDIDSFDSLLVLRASIGLENLGSFDNSTDSSVKVSDLKSDVDNSKDTNTADTSDNIANDNSSRDVTGKEKAAAAYVEKVVELVNAERVKENIPPLTLDEELCKVSQIRADEIVGTFAHTRPDGSDWYSLLKENNISYSTAGENIAAGQSTPEEVVSGWMASSGHRANILNPNFKKIGVGFSFVENDLYIFYWDQIFSN